MDLLKKSIDLRLGEEKMAAEDNRSQAAFLFQELNIKCEEITHLQSQISDYEIQKNELLLEMERMGMSGEDIRT